MSETDKEYQYTAGKPLEDKSKIASEEEVIEAIKLVEDPELLLNVYDMGLIYSLDIDNNGDVKIDMTLTAPNCPVAEDLPIRVVESVASLPSIGIAMLRLVWEPEWTPERLSEEARMMIEIF
ncbi:MAG: iron-sulfur cluster assembly protein [Alphaproteobacteria bacterium]